MPQRFSLPLSLLGLLLLILVGCSGRPSRVSQAGYSSAAGADAVKAYDTDGDGAISGEELDQVPGVRESINLVDSDGNGQITAEEIDARVQYWRDTKVAELIVSCEVMRDGSPLSNAVVTFEPEPFLGSDLNPASGTTSKRGVVGMSMAPEHLADSRYPGVACGLYKVKITSDDEKIPARYNTETTLGCEVAPKTYWSSQSYLRFNLKSK